MDAVSKGIKELLVELLEEEEVQRKIIRIVEEKNTDTEKYGLENRLREIQEELENKKADLEKAQKELTDKEKEILSLQDEIEQLKSQNRILNADIEPVRAAAGIWKRLGGTDEDTQEFLDKLCGGKDVRAYLALGKDFSGIKQLWSYVREKAVDDKSDAVTVDALSSYFDMCIEVYNITNSQKDGFDKLEKIEVNAGDEYDSERSIKTSKSFQNGRILQVLVNGYKREGGKTEFLPIVKNQ